VEIHSAHLANKTYRNNSKPQLFHKRLKILVAKQLLMTVLGAEGGNYIIDGLPYGDAIFRKYR
jgi:hypothetical protein